MSEEIHQAGAYVEKLRAKGHSDEEIREALRQAGWSDEAINSLLRSQRQPTAPKPPPSPVVHRAARAPDVSTAAKAGIIIASVLMPIVGIIWGIVYLTSGKSRKRTWGIWALVISVFVSLMSVGLTWAMLNAKEKVMETHCLSNIKQLALAQHMYLNDWDGYLPPAKQWPVLISAYVEVGEVFACPLDERNEYQALGDYRISYTMSEQLSGWPIFALKDPAKTGMFFDGSQICGDHDAAEFRHRGGLNVAYVDGHCAWSVSEDEFVEIPISPR